MADEKKAIVLGCGLVGATIARELFRSGGCVVTAADISENRLERLAAEGIRTRVADLGNPEKLVGIARDYDIVLGALPSRFGFQTLRAVIEAGRPYCDISFMPEDAMELDAAARKNGVPAIVDCGVSPGLSNLMVGFAHAQLDSVEDALILVGGLPKTRRWPFEYKAPFAPADVIEEYTRPARLIENGKVVEKDALSEPELIDLPRVGTLEGFNTDGLRSLLTTVQADNMREKTLRYPGHAALMRVLRETGYFDKNSIQIGDQTVRPIDVTSKLLFPKWTYTDGEEEFTVLRVVVIGPKEGRRTRYTFDLYDEYNRKRGESSMARTTGFPCVIAARMILSGRWTQPGVFPPERLVAREPAGGVASGRGLDSSGSLRANFDHFVDELKRRDVMIEWSAEPYDA